MNYLENTNGFSMEKDGVVFDFATDLRPETAGDALRFTVKGSAPVPALLDGDRILLPVGEGIALTVGEDDLVPNANGDFCSKLGTMSMVILERSGKFLLITLDNGMHSAYDTRPVDGRYTLAVTCRKECGVTYAIFDSLAEACHAYRASRGKVRTLEEKIAFNPEVKKLMDGGIFWVWNDHYDEVMYSDYDTDVTALVGDDFLAVAKALREGGVDEAMMGVFYDGDSYVVEPLYREYGYLSTQYDNYNDVLDPEMLSIIPNNRARNCGYTARRMKDYPNGVQIKPDGTMKNAWALKGFDGLMHAQKTCCPAVAADAMRREIPEVLAQYPYYKGRFIDVYGCRLGDCYSDVHPLTTEECVDVKNGAFRSIEEMGLIPGTENGFDAIMDHLVYTEGLHSPVIFQIPDSGRKHAHVFNEEQTAHIAANMMQPSRRVPLWELAYHDCMMAFPYWGDSTESAPDFTRRRTLYACLFGCPPLYSFSMKDFEALKPAILASYAEITAVNRKVGTLPMTNYEVLAEDYTVQRTTFGNRYRVTVNFDDETMSFEDLGE